MFKIYNKKRNYFQKAKGNLSKRGKRKFYKRNYENPNTNIYLTNNLHTKRSIKTFITA